MPEAGEAASQFVERSCAIRRYCSFLRDAIGCIAIQAPERPARSTQMKDRKMQKKKKLSRKIALRAVRLQEVKFTSSSKANNYPSIPISPVD